MDLVQFFSILLKENSGKRQVCRDYGDTHGYSHGYGYGVGMGMIFHPTDPWEFYGDF